MAKISKFFRLTSQEKAALLEAAFSLCLTSIVVKVLPFRWLAPHLGKHMEESSDALVGDKQDVVRMIGHAIQMASSNLPWHPLCLPQAITGKFMLKRRAISSTLYMGAKKEEREKLSAHAWLRAGEMIVTGDREKDGFTVVARFV